MVKTNISNRNLSAREVLDVYHKMTPTGVVTSAQDMVQTLSEAERLELLFLMSFNINQAFQELLENIGTDIKCVEMPVGGKPN